MKLPHFSQIGFHHDNPKVFAQSQWQSGEKSVKFLIFRWLLAAFYIGITAYSKTDMALDGTFRYWFIYMTHWGIFISTIATTFGAILTTLYHFDKIVIESHSLSFKIYWLLSNISTVFAFLITLVYWVVLFGGKPLSRPNFISKDLNLLFFRHNFNLRYSHSRGKFRRYAVGALRDQTSRLHFPLPTHTGRRNRLLTLHRILFSRRRPRSNGSTLHLQCH